MNMNRRRIKFFLILLLFCLTLVMGCISPSPENNQPTAPNPPQITPVYAKTIEEAAKTFGSNYAIAAYIPGNYSFSNADCYCGPLRRIDTIYYIGPARYDNPRLTMTQQESESSFCVGTIVGKSVPVIINGNNGNFTQGEITRNSLTWSDGNYSFCISGFVDQEEMKKMAESVKYFEETKLNSSIK